MSNVSVIMSAYKETADVFIEAVESIRNQTYSDFEFIIVLDSPTNYDLRKRIEDYAELDERIVPVWNDANLGLAESLNKAIELSKGSYICRMDADDVAATIRIEEQLDYLTKEKLDLIGSYLEVINEHGENQYPVNTIPINANQVKNSLRWNNCIPHPSWFGKREMFDRRYRHIPLCEDYDFLLRSSLEGARIGNCPKTLVKYRMGKGSISRSNLYRQFLYQCYITNCYAHGSIANIKHASAWVENKYEDGKSIAYSNANVLFNKALSQIRRGQYFNAAGNLAKIPFSSPEYMKKVARLALSALYR